MELFTKIWPVPMPESAWKLLGMYLAVMNYRLLQQGSRQGNMPKLIGAILTRYVVEHEQWIREEFYRVKREVIQAGTVPRFFSPDQLDALESASASQIPDAVRIGWRDRERAA